MIQNSFSSLEIDTKFVREKNERRKVVLMTQMTKRNIFLKNLLKGRARCKKDKEMGNEKKLFQKLT